MTEAQIRQLEQLAEKKSQAAHKVELVNPISITIEGGPNFKGDFDSSAEYRTGDSVVFDGAYYISIIDSVGTDPTDASSWSLVIPKPEKGDQGEQGVQGEKGDTGEQGPEGPVGPQGAQGERGPKGDRGERGPKGDKGDRGERGPKGDRGPKGERGADGLMGPHGAQGPAGLPGAPGQGIAPGGTTGQVLAKASDDDYDTEWVEQTGGGGGGAVDSVNGQTGVVVLDQDDVADGTTYKQYSATEKTKLAGIASGATANDTDANLKNRANHTGTQSVSTITGLADVATSGDYNDLSNTPDLSVFDEVEQYSNLAGFPGTGDTAKFYLAQDTGLMYRWTGSAYSEISASLALGETSATAYRGDRGKTAYDHSQVTGNPHGTTKSDIGLGNVDNTTDLNKPISTATQTALDGKAATSHTHTKSQITDAGDFIDYDVTDFYKADAVWETGTDTSMAIPTPAQIAAAIAALATGGPGGATDAIDVDYDPSGSGLSATNVQDAIDEVKADYQAQLDDKLSVGSNLDDIGAGTTNVHFTAADRVAFDARYGLTEAISAGIIIY